MNKLAFVDPSMKKSNTPSYNSRIKLSESDLISGLRAGDRKTIEALYDMYSGSLYGIILRILKEEQPAEDVLQETFIRIWQSFSLYDAAKGRLFTWMSNVARNLAIDKLKSKPHLNNSQNEDMYEMQHAIDNQFNVTVNPDIIGIREIVMKLKPEHKSILDLIYFSSYSHIEAAKKLDIPVRTLRKRIRMAVNNLRDLFN